MGMSREEHFDWDEAAVEKLKAGVADGLNASQIAQSFEMAVSRNAVLGKIHRMKLVWPETQYLKAKQNNAAAASTMAKIVRRQRSKGRSPRPIKVEATVVYESGPGVGLMDLAFDHCRAPLDRVGEDGLAVFCGARKREASSYCPYHHSIFLVPYGVGRQAKNQEAESVS